jgi:hypothetical protein
MYREQADGTTITDDYSMSNGVRIEAESNAMRVQLDGTADQPVGYLATKRGRF